MYVGVRFAYLERGILRGNTRVTAEKKGYFREFFFHYLIVCLIYKLYMLKVHTYIVLQKKFHKIIFIFIITMVIDVHLV